MGRRLGARGGLRPPRAGGRGASVVRVLDAPPALLAPARAPWRGWAGVRVVLLVLSLVVLVAALVGGERAASVQELRDAAQAGRLSSVRVSGDLPAGVTGEVVQQVRWRDGWRLHLTEVRLVSPGRLPGTAPGATGGGAALPVTTRDLGQAVRDWQPGVPVQRVERTGAQLSADVLGTTVHGWVVVLLLVQVLGTLAVLVGAPQPWWATRWAWFWLLSLPLGATAFLLLSGPLPGRPQHAPASRRLRGGWALVIAVLLARSTLLSGAVTP